MKRAAIYARKSREEDKEKSDAVASVTRQQNDAKAFAASKGWTVAEEHVFVDKALSGSLSEDDRPQLLALLAAAERSPRPFDVVIAADDSRLARDQWVASALQQKFHRAGIGVWYYQEGREVNLSTAMGKGMENMRALASELYRESITRHMRDGMKAKAKSGLSVGGRCFGYSRVELPNKAGVDRVINEPQAAIVRDIFQMYAAGQSPKQIARVLNARPDILVPGKETMTRWTRHQVRSTLQTELYTGVVVSTWDEETFRVERPDLRVISDELWQVTRARIAGLRAEYVRSQRGQLLGRPAYNVDSKYLLVGLLQCASCNGSMTVTGRKQRGNTRSYYYQCLANLDNRRRPCDNHVLAPMEQTNRAVLAAVEQSILNPSLLIDAIGLALSRLDGSEQQKEQQERLGQELTQVEQELSHLGESIAKLGGNDTLLHQIQVREHRKQELVSEQPRLSSLAALSTLDLGSLAKDLTRITDEWKGDGFTQRHPAYARQILRKVFARKLVMEPNPETRTYAFRGEGAVGAILGQVLQARSGKVQGLTVEGSPSASTPMRPEWTPSAW